MKKLHVTTNMKLQRCFLGFENEQRMFSNPNVQNMFKFCQFNADNFARMIETEQLNAAVVQALSTIGGGTQRLKGEGLKIRNPLNFLLKHDKNSSGHEKEDSIIFLSKNDLENMEPTTPPANESSFTAAAEKSKVFQPNKKRWFRNLKTKAHLYSHVGDTAKNDSIDRYQDMSKLIQERFGDGPNESSPPRPSSEISYKNTMSDTNTIQKSFSLQDLENYKVSQTPDIVSDSSRMDISLERNNKSFISHKLYHEFHVKTKQHSKSSSSLHQLLRRKDRKQPATVEERYPFEIKFERHDFPMFEPNDRQDDCSLTVLDDLPYSSVRDSIIAVQTEQPDTPNSRGSENIYAEIFNEPPKQETEVVKEERVVPNFHRICEINNSTRIRISLFNDDPNQTFTAKI